VWLTVDGKDCPVDRAATYALADDDPAELVVRGGDGAPRGVMAGEWAYAGAVMPRSPAASPFGR